MEVNGELTPWGLTWIDKHPEMLEHLPQRLRRSYADSKSKPRVQRFVDLEPGADEPLGKVGNDDPTGYWNTIANYA